MSWLAMLYRTYESNARLAGEQNSGGVPLTVVSHMLVKARVHIQISAEGAFLQAEEVSAEQEKTMIPITESSASRSSGIAPHPLEDQIPYVAGDYANFCKTEKEADKSQKKFAAYTKQLRAWAESEFAHPKVQAVYRYISQKHIVHDLIAAGIVKTDAEGKLDGGKINGYAYEKAIIRFSVVTENPVAECWRDVSLFESFIRFYASTQSFRQDICYMQGETAGITENHPKGIIQKTYGAKLISANDASGFTYRGRFITSEQASCVSYEASQKAHSALAWLIANQGTYVGDRTFVCWNPNGAPVPNVLGARTDFDPDPEEDNTPNTEPEYKQWLQAVLAGYRGKLEAPHDDILILSLEAATPGRLSVTYYAELKASDFLQKAEDWFSTCIWEYPCYAQNQFIGTRIRTPSFYEIVKCAFGTEMEQTGDRGYLDVNEKILCEQVQRLLNCMLTNGRLPRDIVEAAFHRASNPLAYKKTYQTVRNTACALIAKYAMQPQAISEKGVNVRMDREPLENDRSYQFGKLLAVYEYVEQFALSKEEKKKGRQTSALKLWQAFVNHPASTWKTLENQVNPYFMKLPIPFQARSRGAIEAINQQLHQLNIKLEELDSSLGYLYLMGYYHQRAELYKKKDQSDEETAAVQTDAE